MRHSLDFLVVRDATANGITHIVNKWFKENGLEIKNKSGDKIMTAPR